MSGLSINVEKSIIISLNCEAEWTRRMCNVLNCGSGRQPMTYAPKRIESWSVTSVNF